MDNLCSEMAVQHMKHSSIKIEKSIPVHRVAVLHPFTQFLRSVGANVERGFQQAGLPYCALEQVENYVPSHGYYAFLVNMAQTEGIEDLGFRVGHQFGADCADPNMVRLLQQSTTLYSALLNASEVINRTVTHCRVGLFRPKNGDYSYFYHRPSCKTDNPAIAQIGWFGVTTLIGTVQVFTGPHWKPTEIGVMTNRVPSRFIREQFPNTRIRQTQHYSYIALENALLSLSPRNAEDTTPASAIGRAEPFSNDFIGSLEQVLYSYVRENNLDIELVANICNMSKRTLQRKLEDTGTSYSRLLDLAHFKYASRMLKDSDINVTDIAHQLGYNDMSHFCRAFRRITGVTPSEYRVQHNSRSQKEPVSP